ncbi:polarized growth protein Boi2 [Boeremia exigua]|uniref:polarized growth protein Boi2 n=1 Tax=Boeremia exigua TaxID=749465 RepID=UPI001E8E9936|nr:polarized growth protein Boi2 [Boeremia exigua]KAH6642922.1 polarized growth protein Boi2 [Boeremia exigua]
MAMSMAGLRSHTEHCRPGDLLVVVHEFTARSPDELSLKRGDRVELIERDDDFGDGWFLGRNTDNGENGLFPEVYTRPVPAPAITTTNVAAHARTPSAVSQQTPTQLPVAPGTAVSQPPTQSAAAPKSPALVQGLTEPLNVANSTTSAEIARRTSLNTGPRSISMTLNGDDPQEEPAIGSPVMHETLSVIDEHITDMSTPRHSAAAVQRDLKASMNNDSGSEYSSHHRLSYVNGQETEDEEENYHTEEEVKTWSPARVAEYLEDVGVEKKHCDVFRDQDVDGEALLGVDRNFIFMKEFDLGPMGPRLRTWMKINALQQEVRNAKEAAKALTPHDSLEDFAPVEETITRNRASSLGAGMLPRIPTLRESMGSRGSPGRQNIPRAMSSAGRSTSSTIEPTSPLIQTIPASPPLASRPSAASVRSLNHNRRHSSIDYNVNPPTPGYVKPASTAPVAQAHRKAPSFDRNWTMGSPQKQPHDLHRPASSNHMHALSSSGTAFDTKEPGLNVTNEVDKGYFSGGEVDNRKSRNLLRKRDSDTPIRNPSMSTSFSRRHSRIGSADTAAKSGTASSTTRQFFGSTSKSDRSSAFDFVRPLKPTNESPPTVTKLSYDTPSIDAVANSPALPGSETSSTGRTSPAPTATTPSGNSFFSKRAAGLRAISDAITGGERANASSVDVAHSTNKDSPMQSPTRTGSSTPSGTSVSKSFELDKGDRRLTSGSAATKEVKKKASKHGTSAYLKGRHQITPQEAMKDCDYSGWMKKKSSSLMTTWKTRLFVLRGRRLAYYYSENDTEEKGLIDISSHRVLPANNERMTGLHASITRAASSPSSPHNASLQTAASVDSANAANSVEENLDGMFIFKLVPPRAGLQKGVQFTKPIVHYFAVDSLAVGRLWMAALMKATIDRDDGLPFTTTYQQKTISLEKARAMRQRPPNLMDEDAETASKRSDLGKESLQESTIHEEDEKQGLAISGLDDAQALLAYAETGSHHASSVNISEAEPTKSPPLVS